jgi:Tfp pilus assembly protein PilF
MRIFVTAVTSICALLLTNPAWAHLDIEGLPDSVAIISYKQTIYVNPDDLTARNKLAMALCKTGELEEAQKQARYVLDKDPKNFNALDGLGVIYMKMGRHEDAMKYFNEAVKINDKDVMVHVHLAAVYYKMQEKEKARKEWQKARSLITTGDELTKMKNELRWVSGG